MPLTIRILNCFSKSLPWPPHRISGSTCLLLETNRGLLLVDTGLGLHDYTRPTILMRLFMIGWRAVKDPSLAAVNQLEQLGNDPKDVHDIVLTHLHVDHAGGLPDFPNAQVHLYRREYNTLRHPRSPLDIGYNKANFSHHPQWVLHDPNGDKWYDLHAVRLPGIEPEIYLIPLPGHTSGHCGVAVRSGPGWMLLCGDAVPVNLDTSLLLRVAYRPVSGPHFPQLLVLAAAHPEVRLIAGHMWLEFYEQNCIGEEIVYVP